MANKTIKLVLLILASLLMNTEGSASSLVGEWAITMNLRFRQWHSDGSVMKDYQSKNIYNYVFYPNGEFIYKNNPGFEFGVWRKSAANFWLYPNYNGPPALINGPNNSVEVTQWTMYGKKKGKVIRGKYLLRYTITVWDYYSGIVVVNYVLVEGDFKGKKLKT